MSRWNLGLFPEEERLQLFDLVELLPRQIQVGAAIAAVVAKVAVTEAGLGQGKLRDDGSGPRIEEFPDGLEDLLVFDVLGAEGRKADRDRIGDPDRVAEVNASAYQLGHSLALTIEK